MLLHKFKHQLKDILQLQPQHCNLLLAVSGGLDSAVLTDLVAKAGYDFTIAHCNFRLRGAESERDEAFVTLLGGKYGREVVVKKFDTVSYAAENKLSIQEAARILRYQWFEAIVKGKQSNVKESETGNIHHSPLTTHLATAHHANDNIETMMMHFFRGTGLHGLTGIPEKDTTRKIIRPLLFAKREEISAYAQTNSLAWVEDSSNASDKYTRNFFRLQVIPAIKEVYPAAEDNLLHNMQRLKEAEILYNQAIALHKQKLIEIKGNECHIPVLKLKQSKPLHTITWEIIKDAGFNAAQTTEVIKLLDAANGSYTASATHRIIRDRNWLIIAPQQTSAAKLVLIEKPVSLVTFENGILKFEQHEKAGLGLSTGNDTAMLDAKDIKFPLLLRPWKQGDYFYPLGMQKKKKLSRFFIDNKLSKTAKEKVWVVESDKKILWVIGHRIDDRFKITGKTHSALSIHFTPAALV